MFIMQLNSGNSYRILNILNTGWMSSSTGIFSSSSSVIVGIFLSTPQYVPKLPGVGYPILGSTGYPIMDDICFAILSAGPS